MKKEDIKQKIKLFFEDKTNLLFLAIFIFGIILRLKYLTINQAVWYDEAEYLSTAKNWAFGTPYQLHFVRPPLLPFLWAFFYKLGAGELVFRIILLLFSLAGIWLTYSIGKMLFNKYVGIIASVLTSFHYLNLFYTLRLLTDVPSMTLLLFTIYFFWKGYVEEKGFYLYLMGLAFVLSILMRFPGGSLGGVLLIYLLLTEGFKLLKNKKLWVSIGIFFLIFVPYGIWYYNTYDKIPILGASGFYMHQVLLKKSLSFMPTVFMSPIPYLSNIFPSIGHFFILALLIGLGMMLFNLIIGWDLLKKDKNLQQQLFAFLWIMVIFSYFAFYAGLVEDRYFFYIFPACFMIVGWVFVQFNNFLKKYHKFLGITVIIIIIFLAGYKQLVYADQLIKIKADSYVQVRQAGEWIKANSQKGDSLVASGEPMFAYYSERKVHYWFGAENEQQFNERLLNEKPKYMVLSAYEGSPQWSYSWPQNNPDKAMPVQAYFFDAERTKPAVVIYQLVYP